MKRLLHGEETAPEIEEIEYIPNTGRCMKDASNKVENEDYKTIDLEDIKKDK